MTYQNIPARSSSVHTIVDGRPAGLRGLLGILCLIIQQSFSPLVANAAPTDSESSGVTNAQASSTNRIGLRVNANPSNATNGFYKTITVQESGQYAVVSTNRDIVTLKEKAGNTIWSTNVLEGVKEKPLLGERKIYGMQVYKGDLWVSVGRGYAILDIKTGSLKGTASR